MQSLQKTSLGLSRAAFAAQKAVPVMAAPARQNSVLRSLYRTVFKRNITYVTYIFAGAVVLEAVYGTVFDGLWRSINKGVSFCRIRNNSF